MKNFKNSLIMVAAILGLSTVSCTGGGGSGLSGSGAATGGSNSSASITVSKIYPTNSGSSWDATPYLISDRTYFGALDITIEGTCGRAVAKVKVSDGTTTYTEEGTCTSSGNFTWRKLFSSADQGDKTLSIFGVAGSGSTIDGSSTTKLVRIDQTAPNTPTITDPSYTPVSYSSGRNYPIQGTVASDVIKVTIGSTVVCGPSPATACNGSFSYDAALNPGSSTDFSFAAWDLAGNKSPDATVTISSSPISDRFRGAILGGIFTDSLAGYGIESSVTPVGDLGSTIGNGYSIGTAPNSIINELRNDAF